VLLRDTARCLVLPRCNTYNLVLPLALRLLNASVTPSENWSYRASQMGEARSPRWPHQPIRQNWRAGCKQHSIINDHHRHERRPHQPIRQDWRAGCRQHSIINDHHRHERRPHQPIRQDWRAGCKQHSIINDHHRHERLALQLEVRWSNFLSN